MRKRLTRIGLVGLAVVSLSAAAASSAIAKTVSKTATFNQCVSPAIPIAEGVATTATISVPVPKNGKKIQNGTVTAFNMAGIRITDTSDGSLQFSLISPGGKGVALAIDRGGNGDDYGIGAASCSGQLVLFSDAFSTPISMSGNTGNNPVVGSFRPDLPLASFVGGPARGVWTLLVGEESAGINNNGSINAFSLSFNYRYKKTVKKKK